MTDAPLTLGVPAVFTVTPPPSGVTWTAPAAVAVPGVSWKPSRTKALRLEGTPTTLGTTTITLEGDDGYGDSGDRQTVNVTVSAPTPATIPTTTIPPGVAVVLDLSPLFGSTDVSFIVSGDLPAGMTAGPSATNAVRIAGTPTIEGSYPLSLQGRDGMGDYTDTVQDLTLAVAVPPTIIPAPAAAFTEDGYTLPDTPNARWLVNGEVTPAGTYAVLPVTVPTTITITPEPLEGYAFDPPAETITRTFEPAPDPDPEPDPEPAPQPATPGDYPGPGGPTPAPAAPDEDTLAAWALLMDDDPQAVYVSGRLGTRVVRHVGRVPTDLDTAELETVNAHVLVVLEYVRGFTRGRGFTGYAPHRSLQAVIVAAAARLYTNPEQVTYYATGDYSERPATLTGWTAAELGVLRRFRKVYA